MAYKKDIEIIIIDNEPAKKCTMCQNFKKFSDYNKTYAGAFGLFSRCKECHKIFAQKYRLDNLDSERNNHYIRKYNLTLDEYKELYKIQKGRCALCEKECDKLDVDHNHKTGEVRELLCDKCNTSIGMFNDDVIKLQKAIDYLLKHDKKLIPDGY